MAIHGSKILKNIFQLSTLRGLFVMLAAFGLSGFTIPVGVVELASTTVLGAVGIYESVRDGDKST